MDRQGASSGRYERLRSDMQPMAMAANAWQPDAYNCGPGKCVVINNMIFKYLPDLPAGNQDENSISVLFAALGFTVTVHQNLTADEIRSTVESYSHMEHEGAFFLFILSHGGKGDVVFGTDGENVEVQYLKDLFFSTRCPSLAGVPKVFVIDACRGNQVEEGLELSESLSRARSTEENTNTGNNQGPTNSADFAVIFASTHGNVAFTHADDQGSQLTQTFVQVVSEANADVIFAQIMQKVSGRIQELTARQTVDTQSTFTKAYYIKRNTDIADLQELNRQLHDAVRQWLPVRDRTIQKIQRVAQNLQEHHRNVNISRITGASTSIAGSLVAILGFGLAPVTFGASIGLSVIGISVAVLGGATATGASISDIAIEKYNVKESQEQLDYDQRQLQEIEAIAQRMQPIIQKIHAMCPGVDADAFIGIIAETVVQGTVQIGNIAFKIAEVAVAISTTGLELGVTALRVGGTALKAVSGIAIGLSVLLLPIDLAEIIRSSKSLANGSETEVVRKLNKLANDLEEEQRSIREQTQFHD